MIETTRLELRPLMSSDHRALDMLFSDQQAMNSSINGSKTSEEVMVWLTAQIAKSKDKSGISLLAVKQKLNAQVIGYCGLTLFPDIDGSAEIEIGYRLIRKYWGSGYATEAATAVRDYAFIELKLTRLVALIEPINQRSIGVARKIGMAYEKDIMLEGYDHPDHLYSMNTDKILQQSLATRQGAGR